METKRVWMVTERLYQGSGWVEEARYLVPRPPAVVPDDEYASATLRWRYEEDYRG